MAADDGGEDDDAPLGPPPDPSLRSWRHPSEIASANAAATRDQEAPSQRGGRPPRYSLTFIGGCALGVLGIFVLGAALIRPIGGPDETVAAPEDPRPTTSIRPTDQSSDTDDADDQAPALDEAPSTTTIAHLTTPSTLPSTLEPGTSGVVAVLDPSSQGVIATGVVLDGQVLSSSAALENQNRVLVATPDGPIEAIVEGADPFSDLVVISALEPALLPVPVQTDPQDEADAPDPDGSSGPGDAVWLVAASEQPMPIAIGGELSTVGESVMASNGEMLFDTLHTTIRLPNHGAGAALLDADGHTIGMVISCDRQLAVALPIATLRSSAASIRDTGWGHIGWLGIEGSLSDDGIVLHDIEDESPAAAAGLQPGDQLQSVDGQQLRHLSQLVHAVRSAGVGNQIELAVVRDDDLFTVPITIGTRIG